MVKHPHMSRGRSLAASSGKAKKHRLEGYEYRSKETFPSLGNRRGELQPQVIRQEFGLLSVTKGDHGTSGV